MKDSWSKLIMKTKNLVILEKEEEVSLVSLNDEGSFNSLSVDLLNELFAVLKEADDDNSTKTLILRGVGRGFSAGHNLKEIQENQDETFFRRRQKRTEHIIFRTK